MKKPEEIKKGLALCSVDECHGQHTDCPYHPELMCIRNVCGDALAYIQHLESKLNQAVEDIRMLRRTGEFICPVCAYYNHGEGTTGECVKCLTGDGFRWRGDNMDGGAEG